MSVADLCSGGALLAVAAVLSACTSAPTADSLSSQDNPEPYSLRPQIPDHHVQEQAPPPAEPEPDEEPTPATDPTKPRLELELHDDDGRCRVELQDSGFPAYDPSTNTIVTLNRRSDGFKERSELGIGEFSATFVRLDQDSNDEVVLFAPDYEVSCEATDRKAQKRLARLNKRLAKTQWEPMPELALEWIGMPEVTLASRRENGDSGPDAVQAFYRNGEAIVRRPGVKILERDSSLFGGVEVDRFYGHRPTGIVLVTSVECFGEDCGCEPGSSWDVTRWSPQTLAYIDRHPCEDCDVGSSFHPTGDDAAWRM